MDVDSSPHPENSGGEGFASETRMATPPRDGSEDEDDKDGREPPENRGISIIINAEKFMGAEQAACLWGNFNIEDVRETFCPWLAVFNI